MFLTASSAWAAHPQTVFNAARLEQLQSVQGTAPYADLTAALDASVGGQVGHVLASNSDSDPRIVADMLAGYAMTAMIMNNPSYQALAVQSLLAALTWSDWGFGEGDDLNRGHMIIAVSIAYDVLYGLLTPAQQTQVATRLGAEAQQFSTDVDNGIWWSTDYLQNHNWINVGALGVAGYALNGDDSRATHWIQQAQDNSAKINAALNLIVDGSWHEGVGYQQYGWSFAMPYWLAAAQQGTDVSNTDQLRAYGQYWMAIQLPDQGRDYITTHGDWSGWAGPGISQVLRYAAAKYQDSYAAEAASRWIAGGARSTYRGDAYYLALEMIVLDPTVPGMDPSTLPLAFYASDQQFAAVRSNWTTSALMLGVKSGELGGVGNFTRLQEGGYPGGSLNIGHDHMDDASFWLYGDNEWLLPECVGYSIELGSGPPAFQTAFHNTLLVDGTGELGDEKVSDNGPGYPWFFQRQSHLSLIADTTDYSFIQADGTQLYPSADNLQSLLRTFVMARDGYVVLNDSIAMSGSHQVDQVFHFLNAASQSGSWLRGDAPNDRTLGIAVVAPASFTATVGTQTANKLSKQFDPSGTEATIQVHATASGTSARFLELLWPTRGSLWAQNPAVTPLDPAHPESGFSVALTGATEDWVFGAGSTGSLALTGQIGIARFADDGSVQRLVLLGAGQLADQNGTRPLIQATSNGVIEVSFATSTQAIISGTDATGLTFYGPEVSQVLVRNEPVPFHLEGPMVVLGEAPAPPDAGFISFPSPGPTVGETTPTTPTTPMMPDAGSTMRSPKLRATTGCGCSGAASDFGWLVLMGALGLRGTLRRRDRIA